MLKKRISGVLLAGVLFFSGGTAAMAAETTVPDIQNSLKVVKNFEMAEGLDTPAVSFQFTAEKGDQNLVNIPELTVETVTYQETDTADVQNGMRRIKKEGKIQLPEANSFPHAGEYLYTIKEKNGQAQNSYITYSEEQYTLRVRVKNANTGNGLEIASVTAEKNTPGSAKQNKVSEIAFTNTYAKKSRLTIEKQTEGDFADKTKAFNFTITFTKKSDNDNTTYTGKLSSQDVNFKAGEKTSFSLADGDTLVFDSVPVGTRYVVEETASAGYIPSVTVTENGIPQPKKTAANENQGISSAPDQASDSLVGERENKVVFENTSQGIVMTGVVMNNLPFILLVAVAAAALGILIFMKKKISGK